jgi:hypothetical protein
MAASSSTSNSETQNGSDKKRIKLDKKIFRDVDEFPVNFSGVPHIGEKIFGYLDFEDFNSCRTVCKQRISSFDDFTWIKELSDQWIFLKQNLCHKKPKVTRH